MTLTGSQIRAARELLGWSRADLARAAFLPLAVLEVVEDHGSTFMLRGDQGPAIRRALEQGGVEFMGGADADVRLRRSEP